MKLAAALLLAIAALAACATTAPNALDELKGRYTRQFRSGTFEGPSYDVEDAINIRRTGATQADIYVFLNFYNGHSCEIAGHATLDGERLVLHIPPEDENHENCVLTLSREGENIVVHDVERTCLLQFCGMRGSFEGATLPYASRRPARFAP